jgi:hypothetical protein
MQRVLIRDNLGGPVGYAEGDAAFDMDGTRRYGLDKDRRLLDLRTGKPTDRYLFTAGEELTPSEGQDDL